MRQAQSSYPRVNCIITGCRRGTTKAPPRDDGTPPELMCGQHWRMVPKTNRQLLAQFSRWFRKAERKGDERLMRLNATQWWNLWERSVQALNNPESMMDGALPASMAEELRAKGLL